jgi:hypothetical protein
MELVEPADDYVLPPIEMVRVRVCPGVRTSSNVVKEKA